MSTTLRAQLTTIVATASPTHGPSPSQSHTHRHAVTSSSRQPSLAPQTARSPCTATPATADNRHPSQLSSPLSARSDAIDIQKPRQLQRRSFLVGLAAAVGVGGALLPLPSHAANKAVTAGLSKYIKQKKLDGVDTYVPPLLNAKDQLVRVGRVMLQDPKEARSLLRSGAFSGLRDSVRAVGQFVSERGQGQTVGAALVSGFTKELEGLDVALMLAVREGRAVDEDGNARLKATMEALDRLLAALPEDAVQRAATVVDAVRASDDVGVEGSNQTPFVDQAELEKLRQLL